MTSWNPASTQLVAWQESDCYSSTERQHYKLGTINNHNGIVLWENTITHLCFYAIAVKQTHHMFNHYQNVCAHESTTASRLKGRKRMTTSDLDLCQKDLSTSPECLEGGC